MGLVTTTLLGVILAIRFTKRKVIAYFLLAAGIIVPTLLLLSH